ncbi:hypothetical protein TrCOL_g13184 [Triparma columacea]|uniref:Protein kinase domain-containing protein n=1 Tax=Triparma columacea TaxID=722753 RepID=A0A9W7LGU3_9STRA|nr:hypothetical protein TrCOL_g13184 [Triparma columacea]
MSTFMGEEPREMSLSSPQTSMDTSNASSMVSPKREMTDTSSVVSAVSSTVSSGSTPPLANILSEAGHKTICSGRYVVLETLGSGATGKVKLGIDTVTGEKVALKIMGRRVNSKRQADQIKREVAAMTTLVHPNVLALRHHVSELPYPKSDGTFKDCTLLVIELASGGELFDFMMYTGAFSEPIARAYTAQLLSALVTCHANGIYHRDLKPENLLLDGTFMLKVADFGYSAIQGGGGGELNTECGTRSYMAPEILAHLPYQGVSADTWSCGVVVFIMLTGNPPFQIAGKGDWWFNAISSGNVDRFWRAHMRSAPKLSEEAKDFIEQMLKPEPTERASLRQLLEHPWLAGGEAMSDEELEAEMSSRKRKVDEEKFRERTKKRMDKAARGGGDRFEKGGRGVRRGASAAGAQGSGREGMRKVEDFGGSDYGKIWCHEGQVDAVVEALRMAAGTAGGAKGGGNKWRVGEHVGVEIMYDPAFGNDLVLGCTRIGGGGIFEFRKVVEAIRKGIEGEEEGEETLGNGGVGGIGMI